MKTKQTLEMDQLAVDAREAARLLGISTRHLWALSAGCKLPAPIRLGRSVRWRAYELRKWLDAGCLSRDEWQSEGGHDEND